MSGIKRLTAMTSVRRDKDYEESRAERESSRLLSWSVSAAASATDGVGRCGGKSEVDRYLVVRKVSVRAKRDGGADWDREAGKFKSAEMGSGSKVER